jgi:NADPH:quinone reductase-like Zn-dependent oxidoreductase
MVSPHRCAADAWLQVVQVAGTLPCNRDLRVVHRWRWFSPGRKRVIPYSIQWLKRVRPALFREDLIALFNLLRQRKIEPLIAQRFPLSEARQAHEMLGQGGVTGKIVLVCNESSLESGAAYQRHEMLDET